MMMGPLPPDLGGGGVVSAMLALSERMQGGADYSDPAIAEDAIVLVALSDGRDPAQGGYHALFELGEAGEGALLSSVVEAIRAWDPDVLLGHDIYKGSLAYLAARAKRGETGDKAKPPARKTAAKAKPAGSAARGADTEDEADDSPATAASSRRWR